MEVSDLKKLGKDTLIKKLIESEKWNEARKKGIGELNEKLEKAIDKLKNARDKEAALVARKNLAFNFFKEIRGTFKSNDESIREAYVLADQLDEPLAQFYKELKDEQERIERENQEKSV